MSLILVDSNDATQDPGVLAALKRYFGADRVSVTSLQQGDIAVTLDTGLLLIERKRPFDLLSSVADGRIFAQSQRMVNAAKFAVILIQGSLSYNRDDFALADGRPTNWTGKSVRAALRAVQWAGCAVDSCAQGDFARHVDELIALASKPEHYHIPVDKLRAPPIDFFGGQSQQEMTRTAIIASLPGIGPTRARALLEWIGHFYAYKGRLTMTRPPDPDGSGAERTEPAFGRICDAIEWATMLGTFLPEDRPAGWGRGVIAALRKALDLDNDEYLTVERIYTPGKTVAPNSDDTGTIVDVLPDNSSGAGNLVHNPSLDISPNGYSTGQASAAVDTVLQSSVSQSQQSQQQSKGAANDSATEQQSQASTESSTSSSTAKQGELFPNQPNQWR